MKIGYDAKRMFLNYSGLGNYSRNVLENLANRHPETEFYLYTPRIKKHESLSFVSTMKHIKTIGPATPFKGFFSFLWRQFFVLRQAVKDQVQIYHGLSNELPLKRKRENLKLVVTIHDLIFLRFPNQYSFIDRFIYKVKSKYACKRADKIIAISTQTKKDIISFFGTEPNKIEVIYQSCHELFKQSYCSEVKLSLQKKYDLPNNFLLYVGSVNERKNLMVILRALKKMPKHQLVVIGQGGAYKSRCEQFVTSNKLDSQVHFRVIKETHELAAIYQMANIMIYPSLFEGFGIPIIEALYSKTPVVTSKGSCFSEAGGPSSIYINPENEENLIQAITTIESKPELRKTMIDDGLKHVQQFSKEMVADKLHQLYTSILKN
jgi:glycosyltransferase involved in cell wall biosynthesis